MKTAVIKTGGKQYVVHEGDIMVVDRMLGEEGTDVTFSEVLLTADEGKVAVGSPFVEGATVAGKIVGQVRLPKVTGVRMKPKKRNVHYFGHKQPVTEVEIGKIGA
ncbi:MAG: 50S ribosomal protein L21 [Patescibacteria group bacterium]